MTNRFPFTRTSHFDVADNTITLFYYHKSAFGPDLDCIIDGFTNGVPYSPALFRLINERAWPLVERHFPSKLRQGALQETFSLEDPEIAKKEMASFDIRAKSLIEDLRELFIEEMPRLMEAGRAESERKDEMLKSLSYWQEDEEF